MTLSIIIVNYKTKGLVKQCLKNILALDLNLVYEILVIDNNSEDKIEAMLKNKFTDELETQKIKFFQAGENKGMGAGNNYGLKRASGKYILVLNPDVVIFSQTIPNLINFISSHEEAGLVAPKLLYPNRSNQQSRYLFPKFHLPLFIRTGLNKITQKTLNAYTLANKPDDKPHTVDWVRGSAFLSTRDFLLELEGFDERFFMYMEDIDLCRRVKLANKQVWYVPDSQAIHYYSRDSKTNSWLRDLTRKMAWVHIISWLKYFWKWRLVEEN